MGHAGHPLVRTPALDRLARDGCTFDNAYCNSPMCVPSRLSFFSGMYASDIDAWDNGVTPGENGRPFRTWGHYLGEAGYETVLCGRTHFNGPERLHRFERRLADDMAQWQRGEGAPNRSSDARRGSNSH